MQKIKWMVFISVIFLFSGIYGQKKNLPQNNLGNKEKNIYIKFHQSLISPDDKAVEEFIYQNFPLLKETKSQIKVKSKKESPYGIHIDYQQNFEGFQVYHAGIKVNLDKNYQVINVLNYLQNFEPKLYGNYEYNIQDFVESQRQRLMGNSEFAIKTDKIALVVHGKLRASYLVQTQMDNEFSSQEWVIDGETGAILHHQILASFRTQIDTNGKGLVFNPDPLTKAGVTYGGPYVDNNDADVSVLNQQRDTVILKDITYSNGTFKLEGPYVKITEFEFPDVEPVTSNNGNFFYGRAESGFEDVNAYYHLDTMQRYIQSLGFTNLANYQILVDTHANYGQDNSYYTSSPSPRIAFGEGGVDDAEDADVIVHEYGHALSESGSPSSNTGFERQGQDEGIGDYIAASYSRSINPFRWYDIFNWDGHNTFWNGRQCNITTKYPNLSYSNFYNFGELWCTVLMHAWGIIGKEPADKIFFEHLYMNAPNQTLADAAELILDADTLIYNGSNSIAYLEAFCDKLLITDNRCNLVSSRIIHSPYLFKVYPNPAQNFIYLQNTNQLSDIQVNIINSLGQVVMNPQYPYFTEQPVEVSHLPNGLYILQISSGNKFFTQKIVIEK